MNPQDEHITNKNTNHTHQHRKVMTSLSDLMPNLHIDILLLILRALTIIAWIILIMREINVSIYLQLTFVAIIFISDALDGMISRRFSSAPRQYLFRILDALVDKVGMLFFLFALLSIGHISISNFFVIIGYNILLVILPLTNIFGGDTKQLSYIQATIWSRFYAISVGIFCFLSINVKFVIQANQLASFYFVALGLISFISHFLKIRKIKEQN